MPLKHNVIFAIIQNLPSVAQNLRCSIRVRYLFLFLKKSDTSLRTDQVATSLDGWWEMLKPFPFQIRVWIATPLPLA